MSAKKISILTSVHPPFDTRIFHKQARSLVKAGYDVTLIAQHDKDEVVDGIQIVALPKPKNRFWRMMGTWRLFKIASKQQADIYHFHDPELLPVGVLLKILTRGKVVYDVHEDYPKAILTKYWLPSIVRRPAAAIFFFLERWVASWLDYIIAATDDIARKFESSGRVTAIRNFPLVKSIETGYRRVTEQPILIYAGGLTRERGISEIIQAMAYTDKSKNVRLVLYGKFDPEDYQEVVQGLKGFDRVEYRGWIAPEDVWQKISEATVGIVCFHPMPNHINAMPNKLFEYMGAGLPVIASNFPLWKDTVLANNCGLTVDPLNPEEIAIAVEYLIMHPDEARDMGENGRKAVLDEYNWENECKKLLTLYEDLLQTKVAR